MRKTVVLTIMFTMLVILGWQGMLFADGYTEEIPLPTPPASSVKYREVSVTVTAYSAGDECYTGTTMANGETVHEGAVAYNGVPFGTVIVIDGREYTVKDRVGSDGVVDVYMNSIEACDKWGRQRKMVLIKE